MKRRPNLLSWLVALSVCAISASCSDDDPKASAVAADGGVEGGGSGPFAWAPCEEQFECASIDVPVDYADEAGPKLTLRLMRAPARKPEERVGTVVVNPGGPGISMVEQLKTEYVLLRLAFPRAMDRLDVVAFDWRGIGQSSPAKCVDDAFIDEMRKVDLTLKDAASLAAVESLRTRFVDGCKTKSDPKVLASLHTENAARDLDRIRIAIKEEKLNFLGFSYGTWLGAVYASLFPDRVRAFALDAPVVLPADLGQQLARRGPNRDNGLSRFFDACAADPNCAFHKGESATALAGHFDALVNKVRSTPGIPAGGRTLFIIDFEAAIASGVRTAKWPEFATNLAAAEGGDASKLLESGDSALGRRPDGTYDGRFVGLVTISCVDLPFAAGTTLAGFQTQVAGSTSRSAPASAVPFSFCVDWPFARPSPVPTLSAPTAPPMLIVTSAHDPITIASDGAAMVAALNNGSHLVTYEGDGHAASLHSRCIRELVTDFILDPKPPAATTCPPE